jgi:pyruvate dehydrogenase (quinone)
MSQTVGDFVIERLHQWGVRHMFGYPGDGINGVFGGLNRTDGKIKFIQARHEEMAAFMASAYAKFSASASPLQALGHRIWSPGFTMRC